MPTPQIVLQGAQVLNQHGGFFAWEQASKKLQHIAQLFTGDAQRMQPLTVGFCQQLRPQLHHATASAPYRSSSACGVPGCERPWPFPTASAQITAQCQGVSGRGGVPCSTPGATNTHPDHARDWSCFPSRKNLSETAPSRQRGTPL